LYVQKLLVNRYGPLPRKEKKKKKDKGRWLEVKSQDCDRYSTCMDRWTCLIRSW